MRSRSLVGIAVLAVAACSGSSGTSPTVAVKAAVSASIAAGGVHEIVTSVTPTASGTTTSTARGTYSFTSHLGSFNVDTGALVGKVDALLSGSTLYIHLPAALVVLAKGKTWATADLAHPPNIPAAGNLTSLAGGADPSRVFEGLTTGLVSATKVSNTEYTATIDLAKAKTALATSEGALLGGTSVTADVSLDPTGKISRVVAHVKLSDGTTETVTTTYAGYAAMQAPKLPDASETIDGATLVGQ